MDHQQMVDELLKLGFDQSVVETMPDPVMAEILRIYQAMAGAQQPAEEQMADTTQATTSTPSTPTAPASPTVPLGAAPSPVRPGQGTIPTPTIPSSPAAMTPQSITLKYSELQAALKPLVDAAVATLQKPMEEKVAALDKFAEERIAAEKRAGINARLETLLKQGKVLPAEVDGGLADVAYHLDARKTAKFSENGKTVDRTPLDHFFAALEARPILVKFSERLKSPMGKHGDDEEVETVDAHYERFAEDYRKMGVKKQEYIDRFKRLKERGAVTAASYCTKAN